MLIKVQKHRGYMCLISPEPYIQAVAAIVGGRFSKNWKCIVADWSSINCKRLFKTAQKGSWQIEAGPEFHAALDPVRLDRTKEVRAHNESILEAIQESGLKNRLWSHQREAFIRLNGLTGAVLDMGMGPQPLYSKVMTPHGWTLMGEINIGDLVTGADGKPTKVTEVHDFKAKGVYEVTFSDKSSTRCTEEHLWQVETPKQKHRKTNPKVKTLLNISKEGLKTSSGWWKHFIPMTGPVEFVYEKPDSLDPYFVGLLIGDGCLTNGVHISTPDKEIVDYIESILPGELSIKQKSQYEYSISLVDQSYNMTGRNTVLNELRRLGLFGLKSENKFIPAMYLYAPIEDRIALLQGLLDTDGYGEINRAGIEYSTSSPNLASDFEFLVRSLGGTTTRSLKKTKCLDSHRFYVKLPKEIKPFRLRRREIRYPISLANPTRSIRSIDFVGVEDVRCIKVENENGLYITDDFIVTHNTGKSLTTIALLLAGKHDLGIIVCPKSVISVWPLEFERHCAIDFSIYTGPKKKSATIAQYTRQLKKEMDLAKVLKKPFIIVCNYEKIWQGDFSEFIKSTRFDFIVYDEAHRLKTGSGTTSKFASKIRPNTDRIIGCTGTLLPHSPLDAFGIFRAIEPALFGSSFIPFRATYAVLGGFEGKQVVDFQNEQMMHDKIASVSYRVKSEDVLDLPPFMHIIRYCELGTKTRKAYDQMHNDLYAEYEGHELTAANAMVKVLRLQQITSGIITDSEGNEVRLGTEKADLLADVLEDIAIEEPVAVFCRFTADIAAVKDTARAQGREVYELSGQLNELEDWQKAKKGILAVQIRAGKEGVDFTNACIQIYYSIGHSLGDYDQSIKRVHRPGQDRPVRYFHLIAKDTVDVSVYESLDKKRKIVDYVLETLKRR